MSIKQAIEALELAQDALDISQSLQESAKSNHHPKTLAAYERVSAALAALRSMPESVQVPKRPTQAMRDVMDSEGWAWEDLLAAAEAITEDEHAILATPHTEAVRMSEAEIDAITKAQWGEQIGAMYAAYRAYARAVEQATAARLGVKMGDV